MTKLLSLFFGIFSGWHFCRSFALWPYAKIGVDKYAKITHEQLTGDFIQGCFWLLAAIACIALLPKLNDYWGKRK